jgi:hypothetical protein
MKLHNENNCKNIKSCARVDENSFLFKTAEVSARFAANNATHYLHHLS